LSTSHGLQEKQQTTPRVDAPKLGTLPMHLYLQTHTLKQPEHSSGIKNGKKLSVPKNLNNCMLNDYH